MRPLLALGTVFFSLMASGSLLSIALKTYGLNPNGSKIGSALTMLMWVLAASVCLSVMPPNKPRQ